MAVPNYIKELIKKRADYAQKVIEIDCQLSDWLDKQDIDVDPSDYRGGVEIYAAPYDCAYRVLSAIQKKNK